MRPTGHKHFHFLSDTYNKKKPAPQAHICKILPKKYIQVLLNQTPWCAFQFGICFHTTPMANSFNPHFRHQKLTYVNRKPPWSPESPRAGWKRSSSIPPFTLLYPYEQTNLPCIEQLLFVLHKPYYCYHIKPGNMKLVILKQTLPFPIQ